MLYHLFDWIEKSFDMPGTGLFQYISFRSVLAATFSLFISLLIGKRIINFIESRQIKESIRHDGPESHAVKSGTPTMGGIIIILSIVIPTLLWADLTNAYIILLLLSTLWMGAIGFLDDYIKVFKHKKSGLQGKFKVFGQIGLGLVVGVTMVTHSDFQGINSKVDADGVINVTEGLRNLGFRKGDQITHINGKAFNNFNAHDESIGITSIRVENPKKVKRLEPTEITIELSDSYLVRERLFGHKEKGFTTRTNVPFFKNYVINYSILAFWTDDLESPVGKVVYVLMAIFIVTAVSNGVNMTDGLDGLAAGTSAIVAAVLGIFAYVAGNVIFSEYLNITFIPMGGEIFIFTAAFTGACIGFLWYNAHPAQIFMGDTGSLALGAAIAVLALMVKTELLLPLYCGIFFIETVSVLLQVSYFKFTKRKYGEGRRIFKMAPLHHHYELSGLHESKIVTRFWIVTVMLAIMAFATLKLR